MQLKLPGRTYFHYYCMKGQNIMVELMLGLGIDINYFDKNKKTPLMYACEYGNEKLFSELISSGANLYHRDKSNQKALTYACSSGNKFLVKKMLPFYDEDEIISSIHWLCDIGNDIFLRILLNSGIDINNTSRLILSATENGHSTIVSTLIDAGADVNCGSRWSNPICQAIDKGYFTIFIKLLNAGADLEAGVGKYGEHNAYDYAHHNEKVFEHVIDVFANTNTIISMNEGLIYCCQYDFCNGVKQCLEEGADVNFIDEDGYTVMENAVYYGHSEIIEFLQAYISDLEE